MLLRLLIVLIVLGFTIPWSAGAQDSADPKATISALQTEVAELQGATATATSSSVASPDDQPQEMAPVSETDEPAAPRTVNLEIILDDSGSMGQIIDTGETRLDAAKRVLNDVIAAIPLEPGINVGLRVYGHEGDNSETGRPVSCLASDLVVPINGVDRAAIAQQIAPLVPTGWTPIGLSLERSGADFPAAEEGESTNAVVLVTDGLETCDGDPAGAAATLLSGDKAIVTHVIGFALTPEEQQILESITAASGGMLLGAANANELSTALFSVLEELEIVVGAGYVGGNAFSLIPAGDPGELMIVSVGQFDASGSILPVVVRNNAPDDVVDVSITGVARDTEGRVLATGNSQFVRPFHVRPGTLTLGYVYFGGIAVPADARIEFEVEATAPSDARFNQTRDLDVIEASLFEDRVVGEMENPHQGIVEGPIGVSVVCFDLGGNLLSHHQAFIDPNEVVPEEAVAFQTVLYTVSPGCPAFLVAGSGNCPTCPSTVNLGTVPETAAVAAQPTPTSPAPEDEGAGIAETPTAAAQAAFSVGAFDIYFEPKFLSIPADVDTSIEIVNNGVTTHNFSIDALGISVDVPSGESTNVTINAPAGTYDFYCNMPGHSAAGMVGSLLAH